MVSGILQILTGEHAGRTFLLEGKMIVGRDAGSQIRINDRSISRKHAAIEQRDDGFYVVDLGSQNGTLLNDAPVKESILPGTCKLQFGTIEAEFSLVQGNGKTAPPPAQAALVAVPQPAADSEWQSLHPGPANLEDIFTAPKSLDEIDRREKDKETKARERVADLLYAGLMILIAAAGVLIYVSIGKSANVRRPVVILAQGDERLIAFPGIRRGSTDIRIESPIASVMQDEEYAWLLSVKASDIGETKAYIRTPAGLVGILTIIVKGKVEDEDAASESFQTEEERLQFAQSLMLQGDQLVKDAPWRALQYYKRAEAVCRPVPAAPEVRRTAAEKARKVEERIRDRVNQLMQDARSARRAQKSVDAVRSLNEICQLIPDPNDRRHQRVKIILHMEYPEMMRPAPKRKL